MTAWIAFNRIDPIGEHRADIRNGLLMQQQANMHRDPKKRAQPYKLTDFLPFTKEPEKPAKSAKQIASQFMAMFKR